MTDLLLTRWGSPHLCRDQKILRPRVKCWFSSHPWHANDGSVVRTSGIGKLALNGQRQRNPCVGLGHLGESHVRRNHDLRVKCCCFSHPWQEVEVGDGSIARRLGIGELVLSAQRRRNSCLQREQCSGVGLGRLGESHVRTRRNHDSRVKCWYSSHSWHSSDGSVAWRLTIGKGALNLQRNPNLCPRRERYLDEGLGHLGKILVRVQMNHDLGQVCVKSFPRREFGLRRGVKVRAFDGPRSWFRNFLFESIDTSDFDIDSDGGEDSEEPEFDEFGVEFEPRADGNGDADADAVSGEGDEVDQLLEDDSRFFRWKMKNEARNEVRDFQASGRDPDSKDWEDWLDDSWNQYEDNLQGGEDGWYEASPNWDKDGVPREPPTKPERGMKRTIKELLFRIFEPEDEVLEDLQFEERVFKFTSRTTAKFVGVLIIVPWVTDFLLHDFVLVPFLETYVEKVPLAAKILDIRESQKLKIIESLKLERQRLRFEAEIGKAPPLSDDEQSEHIREEALELREEYRLENRQAFASIWSDFAAGLTILLLLILNPQQVAIMRLTGERLFTNISDTGKAFIIILLTDIFLGYHSESGWETVSEMVLEHYGIEVSQAAIYLFVAIVPVTIDACFKLWVFRFFRTLSPSASATFREMQRH